jgi:transposase
LVCSEAFLGLPGYEVTDTGESGGMFVVWARLLDRGECARCGCRELRSRGRKERRVRHSSWGERRCELRLESRKWRCKGCGHVFWQRFPGILPRRRATEPFRRSVAIRHWDGISRSRLSQRERIGSATVERWFLDHLNRLASERRTASCPRVLGIDEHFFTRRRGYATTFCDLARKRVFDVVLGRSEASLEGYLSHLKGKERVQVVCIDLSTTYRSLVRRHFPRARIVADRFHVIRLVNQRFLECWKLLDPLGYRNRGLLSLMRRHEGRLRPEQADKLSIYLEERLALKEIYRFKQELVELLSFKSRNKSQCYPLALRFTRCVRELLDCKLGPLVSLGETLRSWAEEIVTMWRFTRNNGITEGFHNKMEALSRQAYGFRNFENYRLRVRVMCS